jgi:hypothetical protein
LAAIFGFSRKLNESTYVHPGTIVKVVALWPAMQLIAVLGFESMEQVYP